MLRRRHRRKELEKPPVRFHFVPQQDGQLQLEQAAASFGCLRVNPRDTYSSLHLHEMDHCHGCQSVRCPVTGDVSDRLLRLPSYNSLSAEYQERVVASMREFGGRKDF